MTLAFARETDGVLGSPVRVSEDGRVLNGCPDDGAAMAVDPTGAAHLVWPTVADVPDPAKTIFYARSDDGGDVQPPDTAAPVGGDTMSHPQIALHDTLGLVVAWDEQQDGVRRIRWRRRCPTASWWRTSGNPREDGVIKVRRITLAR